MSYYNQTGGAKRHWSFDPSHVDAIPDILKHLVVQSAEDEYLEQGDPLTVLANILDQILAELPQEIGDPVRLVYLTGLSYRGAASVLNIDHKTVKKRANEGLAILRTRLLDTAWVASLLQGQLPEEPSVSRLDSSERVVDILNSLNQKEEDDGTRES